MKSMKLQGEIGRDIDRQKTIKTAVLTHKWKFEKRNLLSAARGQALRPTRLEKINPREISSKCRLCGAHEESILHIVSDCGCSSCSKWL